MAAGPRNQLFIKTSKALVFVGFLRFRAGILISTVVASLFYFGVEHWLSVVTATASMRLRISFRVSLLPCRAARAVRFENLKQALARGPRANWFVVGVSWLHLPRIWSLRHARGGLVMDKLVADLCAPSDHVSTGDSCFYFDVRALAMHARPITHEGADRIRRADRRGTTLTEAWYAHPTSSQNHLLLGHTMSGLVGGLAKIDIDVARRGPRDTHRASAGASLSPQPPRA